MDIKAERDRGLFSLARSGTFRIGTTSGTLPFKIRRLTSSSQCEAKQLRDDDRVHLNEVSRTIKKFELQMFLHKGKERREILETSINDIMEGTGSDINMLHVSLPKEKRISQEHMDGLLNLLFNVKRNNLVLPPIDDNPRVMNHLEYVMNELKERASLGHGKEIVGLIPARVTNTFAEIMLQEYHSMGVHTYAIDASGGNIPEGILGWLNAKLDGELDGNYLLIVLGQNERPSGATGQVIGANDVISVPIGYDGYAPYRKGFADDVLKGIPKEERKRYKQATLKDDKGKRRLFVPNTWGRAQIAGVITDESELLSRNLGGENCTKTSHKYDLESLFNDMDVSAEEFSIILRCHDTELVEKELTEINEAVIDGCVKEIVENRHYAIDAMPRIVDEKKEYDTVLKQSGHQSQLVN